MNHKIKALGLALVAAFAMSAVLASGAQAEGTTKVDVGVEEATLTGVPIEHDGNKHHSFTTFFGSITCTHTTFDGTVKNGAHEVTIEPTYEDCHVAGKPITVTMNGCDYTFKGGKEDATHHFINGTVSMDCPEGVGGVDIHVYENHTKHTEEISLCTYTVPPFGFKTGNTFTNTTEPEPDDVDITTTVTGITVERTSGTFLNCGSATQSSTYTGGTTLRAYEDEAHEKQTTLTITGVTE